MKIARQAMTIGGSLALGSALLFGRTLVLAALIPAVDFGRAAVLAVMMSVIELIVTTGTQIRVFQHPQGDAQETLDALHGMQLLRGILGLALALTLASPLASFVKMPDVAPGFAALGVTALLLSAVHLDQYREMRAGRYRPHALVIVVPAVLSFGTIWPLAIWLGDWWAFVAMQIVHGLALVITSHLVAARTYRPRLLADLREDTRFLLPILATGFLVLLAMQGDRIIVARAFSASELAVFAIALTLTVPLVQIAIRTLWSVLQPKLAQQGDAAFRLASHRAFEMHLTAAFALIAGAVLLGPWAITHMFQPDLHLATNWIGAVAVVQALRLARAGVSISLLARGDGVSDFLCNLPRIAALALAAFALGNGGDLRSLLILAALGEAAGLGVALFRLRGSAPLRPFLLSTICLLPLAAIALLAPPGAALTVALVAGTPFLAICVSPGMRAVAVGIRARRAHGVPGPKPL